MGFQSLLYREIENERLLKESLMNKKILDLRDIKNVVSNGAVFENEGFRLTRGFNGNTFLKDDKTIISVNDPAYTKGTWEHYENTVKGVTGRYAFFNSGNEDYIHSIIVKAAGTGILSITIYEMTKSYDGSAGNPDFYKNEESRYYSAGDLFIEESFENAPFKPLIVSQSNYQVGEGKIHIDSYSDIVFDFKDKITPKLKQNQEYVIQFGISGISDVASFEIKYGTEAGEYGEITFEIEALPIDTKKVIGWEKIDFDRSEYGKVRIDVMDSDDNLLFPDVSVLKDYTDLDMEKYKRLKFKVIMERLDSVKSPYLTNMFFHYYVSAFRDTDINYNSDLNERNISKTFQFELLNNGQELKENMFDLNLYDIFEDEIKVKSLKVSTGNIQNTTKAKVDIFVDGVIFKTFDFNSSIESGEINDFSVFEHIKVDFTKPKESNYYYNGVWSLEIVYERTPK